MQKGTFFHSADVDGRNALMGVASRNSSSVELDACFLYIKVVKLKLIELLCSICHSVWHTVNINYSSLYNDFLSITKVTCQLNDRDFDQEVALVKRLFIKRVINDLNNNHQVDDIAAFFIFHYINGCPRYGSHDDLLCSVLI